MQYYKFRGTRLINPKSIEAILKIPVFERNCRKSLLGEALVMNDVDNMYKFLKLQ